jgi:hypothetical protein
MGFGVDVGRETPVGVEGHTQTQEEAEEDSVHRSCFHFHCYHISIPSFTTRLIPDEGWVDNGGGGQVVDDG